MRLLSIFALLFLISFVLHRGAKDGAALDGAGQGADVAAEDAADVSPAEAREDFSSLIFEQPYPSGRFDLGQEPAFSTIELEIRNLIIGRNNDSFKASNHFCAVGYEFSRAVQGKRRIPARKETVVFWKEGRALYRWSGGDPKAAELDFYNARTLMFSPLGSILLDDPGAGGEWAAGGIGIQERALNVVADCEKNGKQYVIEPFAPPPRGFRRPESGIRPPAAAPAAPLPAPAAPPAGPPAPEAPAPPAELPAPPAPAPSVSSPVV